MALRRRFCWGFLGFYIEVCKKNRGLLLAQTQILERQSQEIRRANEELLRANERLSEANEFKMTALSVVSHDLKNPLNAMIGMASIIEHLAPSAQETARAAASIRQTGERMTNLINELLDNAALDAGRSAAAMEVCNVAAVLQEIVPEHQEAAMAKGQKLVCDISERERCTTRGDEVLLGQAFANLLSNAVKYSPFDSVIRVSARIELSSDDELSPADTPQALRVVVAVEDNGPGFTLEDKQKLFTPFQRLSARPTGEESSHGAGLSIAKQIVERHNGKIWVESQPESGKKGSVFYVSLPFAES